jgi:hypothetical protein
MSRNSVVSFLNLKAAVEREKAVQAIDVHRECTNCVVTFWVMSQFVHFLGASRGCADFRDPTAVFRLNGRVRSRFLQPFMEGNLPSYSKVSITITDIIVDRLMRDGVEVLPTVCT